MLFEFRLVVIVILRFVCLLIPCIILAALQAFGVPAGGVIPFAIAMLIGEGVYKMISGDKQE